MGCLQGTTWDSEGGAGRAAGPSCQGGQYRHDRCAGLLSPVGMVSSPVLQIPVAPEPH